jgi:DNA polymerase-3 subunit alpha
MPLIQTTPAEQKEELLWEKELIGLNLSDDPVAKALEGLDLRGVSSLSDISEEHIGESMTFVGLLTGVRRVTTKKGDAMLVANLEDLTGTIELVIFPKVLAKRGDQLRDDLAVRVQAKVDNRRDSTQLVVEVIEVIEASRTPEPSPATAELDPDGVGELPETTTAPPPPPVPSPAPATLSSPPPTAPVVIQRARTQVRINNPKSEAAPSAQYTNGHSSMSESSSSGRILRLYLPRTDNAEADVRRMQDVYHVLRDSSGPDRVTLYLPNGVGTVVLQSQHTVSLSSSLLSGLESLLGHERVVTE